MCEWNETKDRLFAVVQDNFTVQLFLISLLEAELNERVRSENLRNIQGWISVR